MKISGFRKSLRQSIGILLCKVAPVHVRGCKVGKGRGIARVPIFVSDAHRGAPTEIGQCAAEDDGEMDRCHRAEQMSAEERRKGQRRGEKGRGEKGKGEKGREHHRRARALQTHRGLSSSIKYRKP